MGCELELMALAIPQDAFNRCSAIEGINFRPKQLSQSNDLARNLFLILTSFPAECLVGER
jgi:hypothetical protein